LRREDDNHRIDAPVCRISYWQGYATGRYYAYSGDRGRALLSSASFRTWTWRHGNVAHDGCEGARAARETLVRELHARGWRVEGEEPHKPEPEPITRETVLRALSRISGEGGATAAEVGTEVVGEEAFLVQHLPLLVGGELRRLQLQGKVERRVNGGPPRWFLTGEEPDSRPV